MHAHEPHAADLFAVMAALGPAGRWTDQLGLAK